jgi:hypothetical protein
MLTWFGGVRRELGLPLISPDKSRRGFSAKQNCFVTNTNKMIGATKYRHCKMPFRNMDTILLQTQMKRSELKLDDKGIANLRQRLKQLGVWPEAADQFLALMPHSKWQNSPLVDEDFQWVPKVVEDSLKGVDIGAYYPAFFQKLLANDELRQSFLRALDAQVGWV